MRRTLITCCFLFASALASDAPNLQQCSTLLTKDESVSGTALLKLSVQQIDQEGKQLAYCATSWDVRKDKDNALRAFRQSERYSWELHDRKLLFLRGHNLETAFWQEDSPKLNPPHKPHQQKK